MMKDLTLVHQTTIANKDISSRSRYRSSFLTMGSTLLVTNPAALHVRKTLNPIRTPLISQLHCQFSAAPSARSGPSPIISNKVRSLGLPGLGSPSNGSFDLRRQCIGSSADGDVSASSSDVIVLDVEGMMCGGCVSSVKKILEGQPQVSSANVDLTTHTATVDPVAEAKLEPNWQKKLGESLASHLSTCGFNSKLRGP